VQRERREELRRKRIMARRGQTGASQLTSMMPSFSSKDQLPFKCERRASTEHVVQIRNKNKTVPPEHQFPSMLFPPDTKHLVPESGFHSSYPFLPSLELYFRSLEFQTSPHSVMHPFSSNTSAPPMSPCICRKTSSTAGRKRISSKNSADRKKKKKIISPPPSFKKTEGSSWKSDEALPLPPRLGACTRRCPKEEEEAEEQEQPQPGGGDCSGLCPARASTGNVCSIREQRFLEVSTRSNRSIRSHQSFRNNRPLGDESCPGRMLSRSVRSELDLRLDRPPCRPERSPSLRKLFF